MGKRYRVGDSDWGAETAESEEYEGCYPGCGCLLAVLLFFEVLICLTFLGASESVAIVLAVVVACGVPLAIWFGITRERDRRRRERVHEQRRRLRQQREHDKHLEQQAEQIGAKLPGHLLRSFEEAGEDWQPILRAVLEQPACVSRVCETDFASTTPDEFEDWTAELFGVLGWSPQVTGGSGDEGVDVFIEKGGCGAVVSCKRYDPPNYVNPSDVRDLRGAAEAKGVQMAFLVTTGRFSERAHKAARGGNIVIRLWSTPDLARLVDGIRRVAREAHIFSDGGEEGED